MLNISSKPSPVTDEMREYKGPKVAVLPRANLLFRRWLLITLIIFLAFCFLPWTQNVQANGRITTLLPEDRPQVINTNIAGQVVAWYVREGQTIQRGDTIAQLSEIKPEYLDTLLVPRTQAQADAKEASAQNYLDKAATLALEIENLQRQMDLKQEQLAAKETQTLAKISTQEAAIANAEQQLAIAEIQLARTDSLRAQVGTRSQADVEEKRRKQQETQAKLTEERNKLAELQNELEIVLLEQAASLRDYQSKINKARTDRFTALSDYQASVGDQNKLEVQAESYARREAFYYILAPQDAIISEAFVPGIGETVKEGDPIVSIVPDSLELAVEIFIRPVDLPLMRLGQEVRFIFDGWPAIVFSGWPNYSFGTFYGNIVAIDNTTNSKGEYRILVAPRPDEPWPTPLRPGSGARGLALLDNVPLWYEIWRQLNGFPPEYYQGEEEESKGTKIEKAPVRSIIK
ncbi:MAG: HlyD family efflux transporter periplasmic adaptor subunit [Bacteroidota bacterium]